MPADQLGSPEPVSARAARAGVAASVAIILVLGAVAVRNAFTYPAIGGYDAQEYITYAEEVVTRGTLPDGVGVYHTPPGYPAVAGLSVAIGRRLGIDDPEHLGQLVSALAVIATAAIVLLLARTLWPARPVLWVAAVAFFALLPTVLKTGAMFHPEPLGMLLASSALLVLALMLRKRDYSWSLAVALGVLLGLGQLVRAWSIWMLAVAVLVLGPVAVIERASRREALVALSLVATLAIVIAAPWYAYQATRYSNPVFNRTQPETFVLARRPLSFYVDARAPEVVSRPWSGSFDDRFWAVLYAETWGDYFGIWSWGPGRGDRTDSIDATLVRQSALGLLPTALALVGLVALLGLALTRPREDPARMLAALPPVAAVASILFLAVVYPSSDGDTIKGTYALPAAPAIALCFGFAVDSLARSRLLAMILAALLLVTAVGLAPFVVW